MDDYRLILGDCLEVLPTLEAGSIDACICDPPYPEVDREYGRMTEEAWAEMMHALVPEVRRVLKPQGSAVFVLQPNSRKVGSMRPWLWEFMAWVCRTWNMVQDAWCWNFATLPSGGAPNHGLLRPSLRACVWCGPPDCWRDQDAVLWSESDGNLSQRLAGRCERRSSPSQHGVNGARITAAAAKRSGVTPFNVLPFADGGNANNAGVHGHPAGTSRQLCDWWVRYICPPGGTVLDPFSGSGTVGIAALKRSRAYVGIERDPTYHATSRRRLAEIDGPLFAGGRPA